MKNDDERIKHYGEQFVKLWHDNKALNELVKEMNAERITWRLNTARTTDFDSVTIEGRTFKL